ncbi:hypothetical protein [Microbispora hainanensis]|uniref:Uncharacterized protein n=1 Tax=Microbispora hainanensis TaxID=568844 RepID=A0ABZ1SRI0_9ACTN|nr:hypothetical protein [Microbispora hainanensis]
MRIQRRLDDLLDLIDEILSGEEEISPNRALRPRLRRLLKRMLVQKEIRNSMADVGVEEDQLFEIASGMLEQIPWPSECSRLRPSDRSVGGASARQTVGLAPSSGQ